MKRGRQIVAALFSFQLPASSSLARHPPSRFALRRDNLRPQL